MSTEQDPSDYAVGPRTSPTRNPARVGYDREAVHAVLDEGLVCHVGFVVDGEPVVLPHLYARVGEALLLHGSTGARVLRSASDAQGLPVCVTVTLLDGLVLARSAFHHSMNYRCVVVHGRARPVEPEDKEAALAALVDAAVPGRAADARSPSARELAATAVLTLPLEQVSLKVRTGGPHDDPEDLVLPHWAGVLPLRAEPGLPVPDEGQGPPPAYVSGWSRAVRRSG